MPCRSDYMEPTPAERHTALHKKLDELTRENDQLREMVLDLDAGGKLTAANRRMVTREQVKHRKEDLARLERTLRGMIDMAEAAGDTWVDMPGGKKLELRYAYERFGRVMIANADRPLEPQLDFDPDSI